LARKHPYRRFAGVLANARARLGADVDRYSLIAEDLDLLLPAGLPAHLCKNVARFHTSLFRSLLQRFRAFRLEKIAKNFALFDRLQISPSFYTASADSDHSTERQERAR
jgi:hypothetical protein